MLYKNGKREIGVVVDRVRIEQLSDFGTPAFVGDKVVARSASGKRRRSWSSTVVELAYSARGATTTPPRVRGGRLRVMTLKARVDDAGAHAATSRVLWETRSYGKTLASWQIAGCRPKQVGRRL